MLRPMFVLVVALGGFFGFAAPAQALRTTYTFSGGLGYMCEEEEFQTEFPEICAGSVAPELAVEFRHDLPIWDNEASGCDPFTSYEGCDASYFSDLASVVLGEIARFSGSEIRSFFHADFVGPCPAQDCEGPVPYIHFLVVDDETGLKLVAGDDEVNSIVTYTLADRRSFDDYGEWQRGATVAEPGTLALLGLSLAGLGLSRRRRLS